MIQGNLLIKGASELVTCSGFQAKKGPEMAELHVIEEGALVIEQGKIMAVGKTQEILKQYDQGQYEVIDASGKAVLPGFVDSHTHFVFGGYRAEEFSWRLKGTSYMEIMERGGGIISSVKATHAESVDQLVAGGTKRLNAMLAMGVTTVEGKSGYGLDEETELKQLRAMKIIAQNHPMTVVSTFLGAHAVPLQYKGKEDAFIEWMKKVLEQVADQQLAEFCDIFCEAKVFSIEQSRNLLTRARELGLKLKLHADEIVQLGGAELAAELKAVSADHLLQASDQGIQAMAKEGVVATLLPLTAFSLKEEFARAREMIDQHCAVALATDLNPGSCFSHSIPLVIALATLYMKMTTEEVITALTINGAAAIDRAHTHGSLDVGKQGDVVILDFPSYHFLPYHVGMNTVEKVVKAGVLVFDKQAGGMISC